MKFDLERAKAGDPVELDCDPEEWMLVHYIGVTYQGMIAVQEIPSGRVLYCKKEQLRIAPKKLKAQYRNYMWLVDNILSVYIFTPGYSVSAVDLEESEFFRGWIHNEWQVAEVEAEPINWVPR